MAPAVAADHTAAVAADLAASNAARVSCFQLLQLECCCCYCCYVLPTERKLFFCPKSSPVSHTERRLREGGKVVHQIVLRNAPAGWVGVEGGEAALTVRPVTPGSHGQLLVTALADQGLHLADALLFASLVLEPDLREVELQQDNFSQK